MSKYRTDSRRRSGARKFYATVQPQRSDSTIGHYDDDLGDATVLEFIKAGA